MSFCIAGVSLAAGVGGGGLFVPLLMSALSFDARFATALSQAMLGGGAAAAFLYNIRHTHPRDPTRPLVDFELACLMAPALMSGAQIGSIVHNTAPPVLLVALLCLVLGDAALKGVKNARKVAQRAEEARLLEQERQETEAPRPTDSYSFKAVLTPKEEDAA